MNPSPSSGAPRVPPSHALGTGALCAGVVLGPLLLGCTFPWSRFGLEALMATAVVFWVMSPGGSWLGKAIPFAITAIGTLQLVPLPDSILMRLAPVSAAGWKVANPSAWGSIAVDPAATAAGLRRLLLGLGTIGAVASFARHASLRSWLLGATTFSCVVTLALALAIKPGLEDRVILGFVDLAGPIDYWKSPTHAAVQTAGCAESDTVTVAGYSYVVDNWIVGDRIGPYIISNHFAGGICLMLPVCIAFWLWWSCGRFANVFRYGAAVTLAGSALFAVAAIAKSRAGTASLVLALSVLASLLATSRLARVLTATVTAAGVVAWMLMFAAMNGFVTGLDAWLADGIRQQFLVLLANSRVVATHLAMRMFRAAPVFGTGLGSYYGLSTFLDRHSPPMYFAHNDYAQFLAETGLVGAAIVTACGACLATAAWRFYREVAGPERIRDAGPWAALAGIAAHSPFDWNLHVPANAFLACVAAGLAWSSVPKLVIAVAPPNSRSLVLSRGVRIVLAMACLGSLAVLARDACSDRVQREMRNAVAAMRKAQLTKVTRDLMPTVRAAIAAGEQASRWDSHNAQLPLLLGQVHLHASAMKWSDAAHAEASHVELAEVWLSRARTRAAVIRGFPERAPPSAGTVR